MPTTGMPAAGLHEPITMGSLLYLMDLDHAAVLADYIDETASADDFRARARALKQNIRYACMDGGMIATCPVAVSLVSMCRCSAFLREWFPRRRGGALSFAVYRTKALRSAQFRCVIIFSVRPRKQICMSTRIVIGMFGVRWCKTIVPLMWNQKRTRAWNATRGDRLCCTSCRRLSRVCVRNLLLRKD